MLNHKKHNVKFVHRDLRLIEPAFGSNLNTLILELNHLRKKQLESDRSTHKLVFEQLKNIFHILESIGSARIEGNRTTIAEFIETKIDQEQINDERYEEIRNMEEALNFIDRISKPPQTIGQIITGSSYSEEDINKSANELILNKLFLSQLHKIVVNNLTPPPDGEGSKYPGVFRKHNLHIAGSRFVPPDYTQVESYMDELLDFINREDPPQYDLLKTAIAHHRFAWIHPFDNGNGRTVRLFTYAMLVKQGFNIHVGRIINPTAVFCSDRDKYYQYLSEADTGSDESLHQWCEYVLDGLKNEIDKINKLLNYKYLASNILNPAIEFALERKWIIPDEEKILKVVIRKQVIQASDLKKIYPGKLSPQISRIIKKLRDKKMIIPEQDRSRKYVLSFDNNYLLRGIAEMLHKKGFLPLPLNQ